MTSFPTGVVVVTTVDGDGDPWGLTSNAIASVSIDPPMLLVCVAKTSRTLPTLLERKGFLVNFMSDRSAEVCERFASRLDSKTKFEASSWEPSTLGHPHLTHDSVAYADCQTETEVEAGSHLILVGRVIASAVTDPAGEPLAYVRRSYRSWSDASTTVPQGGAAVSKRS